MVALNPSPVFEGEVLDGKYRVDRIIAAGGMGVVVAATHVQLQMRVALKFLLPEVLNSPEIVERFLREARAAAQIQNEHVARVIDVGTMADGAPYMVMEYLEGQDLGELLAAHGTLPIEKCAGYILEACEAIAEAHSFGIVHRDLKPANLYLARRTRCEAVMKVLDFGISKTTDAASASLTKTASMMGSPYYMSPEQMRSSKDVDARSDIWALGVILYEMITGVLPFPGETLPEIVCRVTQGDIRPIRELRPDVPEALADVICRCLQRDPNYRYANVAELARSLVPFGPAQSGVSLDRICRILGAGGPTAPPSVDLEAGSDAPEDPSLVDATASDWATSDTSSGHGHRIPFLIAIGAAGALIAAVAAWQIAKSHNFPAVLHASGTSATASTTQAVPIPADRPAAPAPATPVPSANNPPLAPVADQAPPDAATAIGAVERSKPAIPAPSPKHSVPSVRRRQPPAPPSSPPVPINRGLNMGMKE
jgi:serine/threonine-protein kinase